MKKLFQLIAIFSAVFIFNSCSKCRDQSIKTSYVDRSYLPDIIPYSDTSTRLFLKNGKDTLLFKSQGLNQSFEDGSTNYGGPDECSEYYSNEHLRLRMAASDSDFFDIYYHAKMDGVSEVQINVNNKGITEGYSYRTFRKYYPPIIKLQVLNNYYDTVDVIKFNFSDSICLKKNLGTIKIRMSNTTYELIK